MLPGRSCGKALPVSAALTTGRRSSRLFSFANAAILLCCAMLALTAFPLLASVTRLLDGASSNEVVSGLGGASFRIVMLNTALVVLTSAAIAVTTACVLAWIDERTDGNLPGFGRMMALAPLLVPPVAGVMGWAVLLDPNAGLLNGLLRQAFAPFGITFGRGPLNVYTATSMVLMTSLYLVPYAYLIIAAALRQLDPGLEEASRLNRAGPFRTMWKVTLPSIAPSIGSAAMLTVISGLGLFSVPFIIGTTARLDVVSVYVFRLLDQYPPRPALALAVAALLFLLVQGLLAIQRHMAARRRHAAVGGRGARSARVRLGVLRPFARGLAIFYILATAVLPLAALFLVSLQPFWSGNINWSVLSFDNYRVALFQSGPTSRALFNSVSLAALTATSAMLCVGTIMLYAAMFNRRLEKIADFATALPATIPHTVVGVCFILAFSGGLFNLYGSPVLLFLAYLVMALPFAGRAASSAATAIGKDLAEASRTFGAGEGRTFRRIMMPLALPGLAAGWAIIFIHTAGEVTASALLAGSRTPVIGRVLMDLWNYGSFPQVAALALIIAAMNAIVVGLVLRFADRGMVAGG